MDRDRHAARVLVLSESRQPTALRRRVHEMGLSDQPGWDSRNFLFRIIAQWSAVHQEKRGNLLAILPSCLPLRREYCLRPCNRDGGSKDRSSRDGRREGDALLLIVDGDRIVQEEIASEDRITRFPTCSAM